jgi:nucleotide-binding universal stress UspA family protein
MTYKTLLVHLKLAHSNKDLLRVASDLSDKFEAKVIGIAACQPAAVVSPDGYDAGAFIALDRDEIDRELKVAETEFLAAFADRATIIEWQGAMILEAVADYVGGACRLADLVITSGLSLNPRDSARPEKPGEIVMQAGRPVLVVPRTANNLKLDHMIIAWKNTREARRGTADALPMLKLATRVTLLELAHESERERVTKQLGEVSAWLKTHDVVAEPKFVALTKGDDAYQLDMAVMELGADIVVAGAYGHSRLREWVFGGVTRDLMLQAEYCTLLSH